MTVFPDGGLYLHRSTELNTLGYVLLRAGELDKAMTVFHFNTFIFRYDPNAHDSYGEALALAGKTEAAIKSYEKVLTVKPEDENALVQLVELRGKKKEEK